MADTRWRIVNDQPREELTSGGTFQSSREITWEHLLSGRTGSIIVPVRLYTPEYVRGLISDAVAKVAAVAEMEGD